MALIPDFPVLNGIAPSWADIQVRASGLGVPLIEMKDIAAINTGSTVEVGEVRGASGGRVRKRTTGAVSYDASITLYREGYQTLVRQLSALAPLRGPQRVLSLVHFGINVSHTPPGSIEIFEYRLKGCRILGRTANDAEGTDAQQIEVPLSVIEIVDVIDGLEVAML